MPCQHWFISLLVFQLLMESTSFLPAKELLGEKQGYELVHFFFLLTFAAAIPAIISGGIAERAKFWTQGLAAAIFVGITYPLFEGMVWGKITFLGQPDSWLAEIFGRNPFSRLCRLSCRSLYGRLASSSWYYCSGSAIGKMGLRRSQSPYPYQQHSFHGIRNMDAMHWLVLDLMLCQQQLYREFPV